MTNHQSNQLAILREVFGELEVHDDLVVLPRYPVPTEVWNQSEVAVCFRLPAEPAVAPYGFWVLPMLIPCSDVLPTDHYQCAQAPLGGNQEWGFFSWSPDGWTVSDNILTFARSFAERLAQR